jgi:hypothetical protein
MSPTKDRGRGKAKGQGKPAPRGPEKAEGPKAARAAVPKGPSAPERGVKLNYITDQVTPAPTARGGGIVSKLKNVQVGFSDPPKPGSMLINKKYTRRT